MLYHLKNGSISKYKAYNRVDAHHPWNSFDDTKPIIQHTTVYLAKRYRVNIKS